jgi:hypothetical protein
MTVKEAGDAWGVKTADTAYRLAKKLPSFRRDGRLLQVDERDVRAAKVLAQKTLLAEHGVTEQELKLARRRGILGEKGRYSLDDVREMRGQPPQREGATAPAKLGAEERFLLVRELAATGGDPSELPPEFWDTPTCPPFSAPANLFRYRLGERGSIVRYVARSAGWLVGKDGTVRATDGNERCRTLKPPRDDLFELPADLVEENRIYEAKEAEWKALYREHRRRALRNKI